MAFISDDNLALKIINSEDAFFGDYDMTTGVTADSDFGGGSASLSRQFGVAVAIGDGVMAVGDPNDDINLTNSGSVHLYDLNGNQINPRKLVRADAQFRITAPTQTTSANFGKEIAIGSGVIAIGDDENKVHLYTTGGEYRRTIGPPSADDQGLNGDFGSSVAIADGRIVIGEPNYDRQSPTSKTDEGAAYIFDTKGNFIKRIYSPSTEGDDHFGSSVAIGNGRIAVTQRLPGVGVGNSTRVYIYDYSGEYITTLGNSSSTYSTSLEVYPRNIAIGSGRIVCGDPDNNFDATYGRVNVHDLSGTKLFEITPPDTEADVGFGETVAIGCGRIIVGAPYDNVGGSGFDQGAFHVYDINGNHIQTVTPLGGSDFSGTNLTEWSGIAIGSGKLLIGARQYQNFDGDFLGRAFLYSTPDMTHVLDIVR